MQLFIAVIIYEVHLIKHICLNFIKSFIRSPNIYSYLQWTGLFDSLRISAVPEYFKII